MKSIVSAIILVMVMAIPSFGAYTKCSVEVIDGIYLAHDPKESADNTAFLIVCPKDKVEDIKVGDKVKIKFSKPKQSVEGC